MPGITTPSPGAQAWGGVARYDSTMKGRTIVSLISLLVGWLLGIATAVVVPELRYQWQTISGSAIGRLNLQDAINNGWTVVRVDHDPSLITLERPRLRLP